MEHVQTQNLDADSERACAQTFLDWYNEKNVTTYNLRKTRDVFPELTQQRGRSSEKNWDFVAQQREDDLDWMAIEVKGLRFPPLLRGRCQWGDSFNDIKNAVDSNVYGTLGLIDLPLLSGNTSQRKKAAEEIARLIRDKAQNLTVGESPAVQYEAYRFRITKLSDSGSSVVGIGKLPFYPTDPIEDEETQKTVKKAVKQLLIAQEKGASRRILLFCARAPQYDLHNLKDNLRKIQQDLTHVVDEVFLVDMEQGLVTQLYP